MDEFYIHVQPHSRYSIFDAAEQLPFSVVFGICRISKSDTDPRSILIDTAGTVFDVPYALARGLLTLYEENPGGATKWTEVEVSGMGNVRMGDSKCISVPSPIHRTKNWKDDLTVYMCRITLEGGLASILKVGKRYRIKVTGKDLGVSKWAYSDQERFPENHDELARLVNSYSRGHATFKVVNNILFPPRLETRMRLVQGTSLEVTVENTAAETITVQPRGHQNFVVPWGPMEPEPGWLDDRPRIIDSSVQDHAPTSSLVVLDAATGEVVRGQGNTSICHLRSSTAELRPRVNDLITLEPQKPVANVVQIDRKVKGLQDGKYKIRMHPKGCRWWQGRLGNEDSEDGKVPARLWKRLAIPLMLESQDEVEVTIKDGKLEAVL
ncbi:uncharacterized protein SETTUDRAFT_179534 [Exserohilum turcica Et28A]|uniref:Uncharacterized protein n=1 Tax=Exserohilum turcicum (strain 28A) TaxID=671987 RepID=R0JVA5_EXST2|nr:uncharacterized protein SETTUDRAFT_179534 [Exserohilum turcica Et28A]EOA84943.1 hypothetical protein SETTUDRAFT_179534 [Exserohilum turcica Et28A]